MDKKELRKALSEYYGIDVQKITGFQGKNQHHITHNNKYKVYTLRLWVPNNKKI